MLKRLINFIFKCKFLFSSNKKTIRNVLANSRRCLCGTFHSKFLSECFYSEIVFSFRKFLFILVERRPLSFRTRLRRTGEKGEKIELKMHTGSKFFLRGVINFWMGRSLFTFYCIFVWLKIPAGGSLAYPTYPLPTQWG